MDWGFCQPPFLIIHFQKFDVRRLEPLAVPLLYFFLGFIIAPVYIATVAQSEGFAVKVNVVHPGCATVGAETLSKSLKFLHGFSFPFVLLY
jgi:hypothetical protein